MERITSAHNPKIKNLVKLHKSNERRVQKLFLVEGFKEIKLAFDAGYSLDSLFWCPELGLNLKEIEPLLRNKTTSFEISVEIFGKIAYRESSDGIIGVFRQRKIELNNLKIRKAPLIIILESIEKPGNLGAILRTADAAGVDAVIICDPKTDIYNPNVVRSSLGCIFTNQVTFGTNEEVLKWLKSKNIKSYAAILANDSKPFFNIDFNEPTALVMGTEADGLTGFWIKNCDEKIIIPMNGKIDSLNVSVSTAILTFEVIRQRNFRL